MITQPNTQTSIHLSASAGSGKTRALKERYLALVEQLDLRGLGIDQAVAITFTDKAAAEIKERVLRGLPEHLLKKIIRGRQDLRISTIHSFCMNLLKRYPLEAGLPPDFGVLDSRDQAYNIRRAVEEALEYADRDAALMAPLRHLSAGELIDLVEFLISKRSRLKRLEIDTGGMDGLLASVAAGMNITEAREELRGILTGPSWSSDVAQMGLLLRSQGEFHDLCHGAAHGSLAAARDADEAARFAGSLLPAYFTQDSEPRKRLPIARTKFRENSAYRYSDYDALYHRIQELLSGFFSAFRRIQAGDEAISLLRIYHRAEQAYQEAKLREGLLDFDDLEIFAYGLLKSIESPDILYRLDRKILHFLVDEFQDTSDIQWAILNTLTEEIFAGQGADKPMPPTLFVVGDAKQSIYRFREANYRLIELVREKMVRHLPPSSRDVRTLDRNYRSAQSVIGTANQVFSALWGADYHRAETDRAYHAGSARLIELRPGADDEDQDDSEADVLARELGRMISSGTPVYEKVTETGATAVPMDRDQSTLAGWRERPAGYGDCALLIQSRTRLKEYEEALRKAGIPFRVVGGIGFYEGAEVQAIMSVLFFLWNRRDVFSLASALLSPLFGLSHEEILRLLSEEKDVVTALRDRHPEAGELLRRWSLDSQVMPLADMISRIVQDTGAYIRFGRLNPQALFNIDKLVDTARQFDRRGHTTLQDFVEWVRNIREAEQREATADMNLPGFEGAVSIMTVHKAKGLEFPIVFLPAMNQKPRSLTSGPPAIIESDERIRLAVKNEHNSLYRDLWEREQQELRREHQRLLYVAMTRARDHLVMIGTISAGFHPLRRNSWHSFVREAIPGTQQQTDTGIYHSAFPDWLAEKWFSPWSAAKERPQSQAVPAAFDPAIILANLAPIPASETPEWRSATDFISKDRELPLEPLPGPQRGAPSALVRGSFLHRCLEELAITGDFDASGIVETLPDLAALSHADRSAFLDETTAVIRKIQDRPDLAWILERGRESYAELPFLYRRGNDVTSGVIDRVVLSGDSARVIDYKAILPENADRTTFWTEHYRPQIRIYCEAVKEIFGVKHVEGFLLFLDGPQLESVCRI